MLYLSDRFEHHLEVHRGGVEQVLRQAAGTAGAVAETANGIVDGEGDAGMGGDFVAVVGGIQRLGGVMMGGDVEQRLPDDRQARRRLASVSAAQRVSTWLPFSCGRM